MTTKVTVGVRMLEPITDNLLNRVAQNTLKVIRSGAYLLYFEYLFKGFTRNAYSSISKKLSQLEIDGELVYAEMKNEIC